MLDGEYWLSPPPLSLFYHLLQAGSLLYGRRLFFSLTALWVLVGWIMFLHLSVLYKNNPVLPFPCVLHERSHCHSTYAVSVSLTFFSFFSPLSLHRSASCNPLPPLAPSLDQGQCWGFVKPMQGDSDRQESEACVMQGCCCCCWGSSPQRLWPR